MRYSIGSQGAGEPNRKCS